MYDSEILWRRISNTVIYALAIAGYVAAYFSSADLLDKLHLGDDVQKLLAIGYILLFSVSILFYLIYRLFVADRKEKFANITPLLHSIVGRCKDLWSEIAANADSDELLSPPRAERLLKDSVKRLREICDETAHVYSMLTGTHCRASIKVITRELDGEAYVITLARDNLTHRRYPFMDERRRKERADPLSENSEFLRLADDEDPTYVFLCNDISRHPNFACTSVDAYKLNRGTELKHRRWWERIRDDGWPLPYRSTLTVAVRNSPDLLSPGEPSVVGFLAVDSESRNVFSNRWDEHVCSLVANALFHPVNLLLALMPDDADNLADAAIDGQFTALPERAAQPPRTETNQETLP